MMDAPIISDGGHDSTNNAANDRVVDADDVVNREFIESNILDNITVQFLGEETEDIDTHDRVLKGPPRARRKPIQKLSDDQQAKPYSRPSTSFKDEVTNKKRRLDVPRNIDRTLLKKWKRTLDKGDKIQCPISDCVMVYTSIPGIKYHYRKCDGFSKLQEQFRCEHCDQEFSLLRLLKRHKTVKHSTQNEVQPIETLEDAVRFILPETSHSQCVLEKVVNGDESTSNKQCLSSLNDTATSTVLPEQTRNDTYQIVEFIPNVECDAKQLSVICSNGDVVNVEMPQENDTDSNMVVVHWEVPVAFEDLMKTVDRDDTVNGTNHDESDCVIDGVSIRGRGRGRPRGRGRGRGRGRPRASVKDSSDQLEVEEIPEVKTLSTREDRYSRRRGLRSSSPGDILNSLNTEVINGVDKKYEPKPKKKRRGRTKLIDSGTDKRKPIEIVKCGVCCKELEGVKKFEHHALQSHNGLARPYGEDQEFTVMDRRIALMNTTKKIGRIRCLQEGCRKTFTTVAGYAYHERLCGKSEDRKIECELCGKMLVPESLYYHMKTFHPPTPPPQENSELVEESLFEKDGTRMKRAAATKALKTVSRIVRDDVSFVTEDHAGDNDVVDTDDHDFTVQISEGDEEMELNLDDDNDDEGDHVSAKYNLLNGDTPIDELYTKPKKIHISKKMFSDWRDELKRDGNLPCRNDKCDYIGDSIQKVEGHYKTCQYSQHGGLYTCLVCQFATSTKLKMRNHITAHRVTLERSSVAVPKSTDYEYLSNINLPEELKKRKTSKMPTWQRVYKGIRSGEFGSKFFKSHFDFAIQFFDAHYSRKTDVLFSKWRSSISDWRILTNIELNKYLPVSRESVPIKAGVCTTDNKTSATEKEFRTLKLFDLTRHDGVDSGTITCFVGGPVWALSWCPTPHKIPGCRQYLAVACQSVIDATHSYRDIDPTPGLIQIWDVGVLETAMKPTEQPKLAFGIAHDYGSVWSIVWCPSGCWEDPDSPGLPRLGIMAVAFADGFVRIYSVPHPGRSSNEDSQPMRIYDCQPVAVLELHSGECRHFQAVSLSWLRSKDHGFIAVGYTNGFIGIYDLTTTSSLLRELIKGYPERIKSCQAFQAHGSVITGLDFAHGQHGNHLVSVGRDRCLKFWDLRDTTLPYNVVKKSWFTSASWMPHWCGACVSSDDALSLAASGTNYYECGYYGENFGTLLSHNANVWDASTSYWLNSIVSCDGAGEVAICFMGHLMQLYGNLKMANYRRLPLYRLEAKLKPDEGSTPTTVKEPRTFAQAMKYYDLSIKDQPLWDFKKISFEEIKRVSTDTRMLDIAVDMFPLTSINRVAWNPNLGSHLWIASGCQLGLLRLIKLEGLEDIVPVAGVRDKLL